MTEKTIQKTEDNPVLVAILTPFILLLLLYLPIKFFVGLYWIDRQASIKMQNPNNLTTSCVSFVRYTRVGGRTTHPTTEYSVDGIVFNSFSMKVFEGTPAWDKIRQFYDDVDKYQHSVKCYKVSYLHLDYILAEKTYIYDYFGFE